MDDNIIPPAHNNQKTTATSTGETANANKSSFDRQKHIDPNNDSPDPIAELYRQAQEYSRAQTMIDARLSYGGATFNNNLPSSSPLTMISGQQQLLDNSFSNSTNSNATTALEQMMLASSLPATSPFARAASGSPLHRLPLFEQLSAHQVAQFLEQQAAAQSQHNSLNHQLRYLNELQQAASAAPTLAGQFQHFSGNNVASTDATLAALLSRGSQHNAPLASLLGGHSATGTALGLKTRMGNTSINTNNAAVATSLPIPSTTRKLGSPSGASSLVELAMRPSPMAQAHASAASTPSSLKLAARKNLLAMLSLPPQDDTVRKSAGQSPISPMTAKRPDCSSSSGGAHQLKKAGKLEQKWMCNFRLLEEYKRKHGDCIVPRGYSLNPKLASWVAEQRKLYKSFQRCGGSLTQKSRIDMLNSLNFTWDAQEEAWRRNFADLRRFREKHGHCNVPHNSAEYPRLGLWVKEQRRHYMLRQRGQKSHTTPARIEALEELDFYWDSLERTWKERYEELVEYKRINGDCNVPANASGAYDRLATWVQNQRRQYRSMHRHRKAADDNSSVDSGSNVCDGESRLSSDRTQKLESLGLDWDPRNRMGTASSSIQKDDKK